MYFYRKLIRIKGIFDDFYKVIDVYWSFNIFFVIWLLIIVYDEVSYKVIFIKCLWYDKFDM